MQKHPWVKWNFLNMRPLGRLQNINRFYYYAVQEKASAIIQKHNTVLASEKDREIFFDAIMNQSDPNQGLCDAAKRYKLFVQENK